jgi:hypothetical protein
MEVTFKGGPFDGRKGTVYGIKLRVAAGYDYNWKHACGHQSVDFGEYDREGNWTEPERDVTHANVCQTCDEFGKLR